MSYVETKSAQPEDIKAIEKAVNLYFRGTYNANEDEIRAAFYENSRITGFFDGSYIEWNLDEFIGRVLGMPSQKEMGDTFRKNIVFIDQHASIAIVKAYSPAMHYEFYDYITLARLGQEWKIIHKSFTNEIYGT